MRIILLLLCAVVCALGQINRTTATAIQAGDLYTISDAGANDTYTGCPTIPVTAYATKSLYVFKPNTVNTGAATLNVCSLGAKSIKTSAGNDPADGELAAGKYYLLAYDGTNLQIVGGGAPTAAALDVILAPGADGCVTPTINGSTLEMVFSKPCLEALAYTWTGYHNMSGGQWRPPESVYASLPTASSNTGKVYMVTDGASTACAAGSGSTRCLVVSNGSAWVSLGDGTGSSGDDPLDTSVFTMVEEFIAANNPSGVPNYGVYGWLESVSGGTADTGESTNGAATNWADGSSISLSTTSGINNRAAIACCGTGGNAPWYALGSNTNWESRFTFRNDAFFSDEVNIRVGFADAFNVAYPSNFIGVSFMKNTGCTNTGTDTSWKAETRSGGSSTRTAFSTPLSFTTAQIITFRIRSTTAGTILLSYRTANSAYSSETSIATTVPTSNMMPIFQIVSCNTGENHLINAMRFSFRASGLTYR